MKWLMRFLNLFTTGGVLKYSEDGTPLILVSSTGTTSLTEEGIRRALETASSKPTED